jgi:hypothetical protein
MQKTLRTFGLASVLLTGVAATGFAASPETPADQSQSVTGTQQTMPRTPTGSMNTTGTTSQAVGPDATRPATPLPSGGEGTSSGGAGSGGAGAGGGSR